MNKEIRNKLMLKFNKLIILKVSFDSTKTVYINVY